MFHVNNEDNMVQKEISKSRKQTDNTSEASLKNTMDNLSAFETNAPHETLLNVVTKDVASYKQFYYQLDNKVKHLWRTLLKTH